MLNGDADHSFARDPLNYSPGCDH